LALNSDAHRNRTTRELAVNRSASSRLARPTLRRGPKTRTHQSSGYGAGTLIMGAVAPVIMAVLAAPVWIMFFNV